MCGIAGILDYGAKNSTKDLTSNLRKMLVKMEHRGPDDMGTESFTAKSGEKLHIGHQRLSVIEPGPGGHQPMSNNDGSIWITTNSEIYNYLELKKELQNYHKFQTNSDTEVLLKSYETWGIDCLEKLRGMFAFAIWDSPNNRLVIARDRLGIKPLYYYQKDKTILFSSELRAILATNLISGKISPTGIYQYLSYGRPGFPESIVDSIKELPPGHFLIANKNGIQIKEYWNPFKNIELINNNISINEQIRQVLNDAVSLRLISDVPLGTFLSGGIDSSALAGIMSENSPNKINTISVTYKEKFYDESKFSKQIARGLGTNHHEINLSENDLIRNLPHALDSMDQPTVNGINTYIISQVARKKGLKVALSGLGGDELFGGYDSFKMISGLNQFYKISKNIPVSYKKKLGYIISKLLKPSDKTTKLIHLINDEINGAHVYFLIRSLFCTENISNLFADHSIMNVEILNNFEKTKKIIDSKSNFSLFDLTSYLELTQYTAPTLLRDTDVMSMVHGLEVRVPLLDHKLVELIFSIPSENKKLNAKPKSLLVDSLKQKLPNSIVNRKKMGFTLPFENWMRNEMKSEIESVLLSPSQKLNDYISEFGVKQVWSDFLNKRCSWSRPWALYVLKVWVDKNL